MNNDEREIAVVGAGISGVAAASSLAERGYSVSVFDKGRGPGGRMARRRADQHEFDHGAQYFTVRDQRFRARVDDWLRREVVQPWNPRIGVLRRGEVTEKSGSADRYVGSPGMNAPVKDLAKSLSVTYEIKAGRRLSGSAGRQTLSDAAGRIIGSFDAVILAMTPEQAAPLLPPTVAEAEALKAVRLDPCWAVMVVFDSRPDIDLDAAFVHESPLSWVARNASKPGRPESEAWVLHAGADWSREHEEADRDWVVSALLSAFREELGRGLPSCGYAAAHRWRYAKAASPLKRGSLWDPSLRLGLCGDWCNGSRVEGAFLSGLSVAEEVSAALESG